MSDDEEKKKVLVERPNKEQMKRETKKLKGSILQLITLPAKKLDEITLSATVRIALLAAKAMKRSALKRQIKYIIGLMRESDLDLLENELVRLTQPRRVEVQAFHDTEQWRDALIAGDEALINKLVVDFPTVDRQKLRQLVRNAQKKKEAGSSEKAARVLFRYLVEVQVQGKN